jgi:hypothetical protein
MQTARLPELIALGCRKFQEIFHERSYSRIPMLLFEEDTFGRFVRSVNESILKINSKIHLNRVAKHGSLEEYKRNRHPENDIEASIVCHEEIQIELFRQSTRSHKEEVIGRVCIEIAPVWAQITTQLPGYFPIDLSR